MDLLAGAKVGCAAVRRAVDGASVRMVAGRVRARRWSTLRARSNDLKYDKPRKPGQNFLKMTVFTR